MSSEAEIKKILAELPVEARRALEKEILGSSKAAFNILKAIKEKGWVVGKREPCHWDDHGEFTEATPEELGKLIDIELEKEGML